MFASGKGMTNAWKRIGIINMHIFICGTNAVAIVIAFMEVHTCFSLFLFLFCFLWKRVWMQLLIQFKNHLIIHSHCVCLCTYVHIRDRVSYISFMHQVFYSYSELRGSSVWDLSRWNNDMYLQLSRFVYIIYLCIWHRIPIQTETNWK